MSKIDCVIIGASLFGVWLALELKKRGTQVIVLDREKPISINRKLSAVLDLTPATSAAEQTDEDLISVCSRNFECMADRCAPGAVRMIPDASDRQVIVVDEGRLWASLVDVAIAQGIEFYWNHFVTGVKVGASGLVAIRTFHGTMSVECAVVAAGAATPGILSALGILLPIIPETAYWGVHPIRLGEPRLLRIPIAGFCSGRVTNPSRRDVHDSVILTGEPEGSIVGRFSVFGPCGPRSDDLATLYLSDIAAAAFRIAQADISRIDIRTHAHVTADWLPICGHVPGFDGLYLAVPHGPRGNALVPAMAIALADLIEKRNTPVWATSWSPARFAQSIPGSRKVVMK